MFLFDLLPLLAFWSTPTISPERKPLEFQLRHIHASSHNGIAFASPQGTLSPALNRPQSEHHVETTAVKIYRPPSFEAYTAARHLSLHSAQSLDLPWEEHEIEGPDVTSRLTLLELAKITNNAYVVHNSTEWYDLDGKWTDAYPFGFDGDGFRGHIFATPDNSTVILSIKGTSAAAWFGGGGDTGETAKKDKFNDNLLFSCCCSHVDWTWTNVCGCYRGGWKCDSDCLQEALVEDSLFYPVGTNLYNNVSYMYPNADIWVTGHSLGGALASLLGITFGIPVVAFESPGEKMAASRLHLALPPSTQHITHIFHTADPIAMGTCNGILSSCAIAGYAMESRCHLGKRILYDTISTLGWAVDIRKHGIVPVIKEILSHDWPPSVEVGREVPEAEEELDCVECYSWDFGDYPAP